MLRVLEGRRMGVVDSLGRLLECRHDYRGTAAVDQRVFAVAALASDLSGFVAGFRE